MYKSRDYVMINNILNVKSGFYLKINCFKIISCCFENTVKFKLRHSIS